MMKSALLSTALLLLSTPVLAQHGGHDGHGSSDEDAVKAVIVDGYIVGMHVNRDADAARAALHPEFIMHVSRDGNVRQVTIDQWTSRLSGEKNENEVTYEFDWVDVTDAVAKAKLRVFVNGEHVFTDYMGLYKFDDGWKIVNKIFAGHR